MAKKDFKKQMAERRTAAPRVAIPQIDPEAPKPKPAEAVEAPQLASSMPAVESAPSTEPSAGEEQVEHVADDLPVKLTIVDSDESPAARGTQMRPSRHMQLRDLAYIENRKFWLILDDALELYVTKNYGRQYRRK